LAAHQVRITPVLACVRFRCAALRATSRRACPHTASGVVLSFPLPRRSTPGRRLSRSAHGLTAPSTPSHISISAPVSHLRPYPVPSLLLAAAAKTSSSSSGPSSFIAGKPKEALGLNPAVRVRAAPAKPRDPGAVKKHKKWLRQLQSAKRELEEKMVEEQAVAAERKRKFQERERKMRETVRAGGAAEKNDYDDAPANYSAATKARSPPRAAAAAPRGYTPPRRAASSKEEDADAPSPVARARVAEESATAALQAQAARKATAAGGKRPAWTRTEEGAKEQEAKEQEEEVDDLLGFVEDLNFEDFVDDLEVQTALRAVKERVSALQAGATTMRDSEAIAAAAAQAAAARRAAAAASFDEYEVALGGEGYASLAEQAVMEEERARREAKRKTRELLAESERLRSVHSRASLEAAATQAAAAAMPKPKTFQAPRVVSHDDEFSGGTRLSNKSETSRLPYLNRNPAV